MKTFGCLVLLLCGAVAFAAQQQAKSLQIRVLETLNFGSIKVAGVNGSIRVSANSPTLVTTTGGVYAIAVSNRRPTRLEISGQDNTLVFLNLQQNTVLRSKEGKTLTLDLDLNSSLCHLGPTGRIADVYIGGTLQVDGHSSAGDYQGEFSITVDYQ